MRVELVVTHKQGWLPNPDYAVRKLSRHWLKMPTGFEFRLGQRILDLEYEGKNRSCFAHPKQIVLNFTIPVGFVTDDRYATRHKYPDFPQQDTKFVQNIDEYILFVTTKHETQVI